jgi:hypothetical protein
MKILIQERKYIQILWTIYTLPRNSGVNERDHCSVMDRKSSFPKAITEVGNSEQNPENSKTEMGVLALLLPLVSLHSNPLLASPVHPYLSALRPSRLTVLSRWRCSVTVRASKEAERRGAGGESLFFDENGVVEDMDGYLNHLSLEYDSVWDTKPAWSVKPNQASLLSEYATN